MSKFDNDTYAAVKDSFKRPYNLSVIKFYPLVPLRNQKSKVFC